MTEPGSPSSQPKQSQITASAVGGPVPAFINPNPIPAVPNNPQVGTIPPGPGVLGRSNTGAGIRGESIGLGGGVINGIHQPYWPPGDGVFGQGATGVHGVGGDGVFGEGYNNGVHGRSTSSNESGVLGENNSVGYGVSGSTNSTYQPGALGTSGVWGHNSGSGIGVKGTSVGGDAVVGVSTAVSHAGVSAVNDSGGFGVWARGATAGHFEGKVEVTGDLSVGGNLNIASSGDVLLSDCAEFFDLVDSQIESGTVVVIGRDGRLCPSTTAYDKRVAGVVSGGGTFRPGIILGDHPGRDAVMPVALVGRVFCKVDADHAPVAIGDLLTTSTTPGHAMKAVNMPAPAEH